MLMNKIMRNVEIKAQIKNLTEIISKAKALSGTHGALIKQNDMFYKVQEGRLKLRKFEDGNAELIYYERPDSAGPKMSNYEKCWINSHEVDGLNNVLGRALGEVGAVAKIRHLFLIGQTRVHIDQVEGLGNFMELEVVLEAHQELVEGEKIAFDLMAKLGVDKEQLLVGSYRDMLSKKN